MDDSGGAIAIADLKASSREEAKVAALHRAIGFVAQPPVILLYENNEPIARCIDCGGDSATWTIVQ